MDTVLQYFRLTTPPTSAIYTVFAIIFGFILFYFIILKYLKTLFYTIDPEKYQYFKSVFESKNLDVSALDLFLSIVKSKYIKNPDILLFNTAKMYDFIISIMKEYNSKQPFQTKFVESKKTLYQILNAFLHPYKNTRQIIDTHSLETNQKIIVEYRKQFARSHIISVTEQNIIIQRCSLPPNENTDEKIVSVYFYLHNDSGYMFRTKILRDISNNQMQAFLLEHTKTIVRLQKRKLLRKSCKINADLLLVLYNESAKKFERTSKNCAGTIKNISSGGLMIEISHEIEKEILMYEYFLITFQLNNEKIRCVLKIILVDWEENTIHAQFMKFFEDSYTTINDYIFLS